MKSAKQRRTVTMTVSLAASFGVLVFVAVITVLGIEFKAAQENTIELVREVGTRAIADIVGRIDDHFEHVELQMDHVADSIRDGLVVPDKSGALGSYLHGAMAGIPQVHALRFVDRSGALTSATRVHHDDTGLRMEEPHDAGQRSREHASPARDHDERGGSVEISTLQGGGGTVNGGAVSPTADGGARWTGLSWEPDAREAMIVRQVPVHRPGEYLGTLMAWVGVDELSHTVTKLGQSEGIELFVLHEEEEVIAHARMDENSIGLSSQRPLPRVSGYSDEILASIWRADRRVTDTVRLDPPLRSHTIEVDGERYAFLYREITHLGVHPWLVGGYLKLDKLDQAFQRLAWALVAGILVLLGAMLVAIQLGRRIARPVTRFAVAAQSIADLRFQAVEPFGASRIRELNQLASAFNAMMEALRWFDTYLPRSLVRQLLLSHGGGQVASETRNLTVMFTDIVGFSTTAEGRDAKDVAEFLNEHFSLVFSCVEAEGGTLDKFIGDSAMVFWGAPDPVHDHADRACRAALRIAEMVAQDNQRRLASGHAAIAIRIGIHTGAATVGNIGAPGRMNYTIVGDVVNIASRVEQIGRNYFSDGQHCQIVLTSETVAELTGTFSPFPLGRHAIKGRSGALDLYTFTQTAHFPSQGETDRS